MTRKTPYQATNRIAAQSEFAAKLDEFMEQMKLDSERLLMFGDEPEESEESEESKPEPNHGDFSTYQMVLEAGEKKITQKNLGPQSNLRLLA